jgi:hypothetical protein
MHQINDKFCGGSAIPEQYETDEYWSGSVTLGFLMRPHEQFQKKLARAKEMAGIVPGRKIIGMHVRHTDSCWESGRGSEGYCCPQFEDYMRSAQRMQDKYGVNEIFLATDNQHIIDHQVVDTPL